MGLDTWVFRGELKFIQEWDPQPPLVACSQAKLDSLWPGGGSFLLSAQCVETAETFLKFETLEPTKHK